MKKLFAWTLVVAMVAMLAVGCASTPAATPNTPTTPNAPATPNTPAGPAEQTLVIAHISPQTGAAANYGFFMHHASLMATEEINAAGGITGPNGEKIMIEHHMVDETSNSAQTVESAQKAVSLNPHVILGPNRSGGVIAAENVWTDAKIPTITDPTGTNTNNTEYTFRMQIASPYWVPLLAKTAIETEGRTRLAMMAGLNDYSEAMAREVEPALKAANMELVANETFNDGDTDFSAQWLAVKNANPDGVFLFGYGAEVSIIIRQRTELGMKDIRLYGERFTVPAVIEAAGVENFTNIVTTTTLSMGDPRPEVQAFFKKYNERFPEDKGVSPTHINHYDSVYIIADIVSRVGVDSEKIRDELANLKDFKGALATYSADSAGDLVHHMFTQKCETAEVWEVMDFMEFPLT